ncbi:hypothetical protein [Roseicitreum antarcticum]|uniref:Uncharacterized protein n=1 Tax=Roseicitreum antarcticum TaxID=564137 RepID=A0A1H2U4W7_9RHOB|nr:hypothetical protein [Roseicitreum antarcticum]SDW50514.1 hypothetical protein SAMN04488238_102263 [Roseicitreum antarcticum]
MPRTDATPHARRPTAGPAAICLLLGLFLMAACQFLPKDAGTDVGTGNGGDPAIQVDVLPPANVAPDTPGGIADSGSADGVGTQAGPSSVPADSQAIKSGPAGAAPDTPVPNSNGAASQDPNGISLQSAPDPLSPFFAAEQAACLGRGGIYQRVGLGEIRACVFTTRDNGKTCASGADCEGTCLARSGTCAPLTPLYGCHEIVQDNGLRTTQCLQ